MINQRRKPIIRCFVGGENPLKFSEENEEENRVLILEQRVFGVLD